MAKLDAAGLSAREIAEHLDRVRPSMTQDIYMRRKTVSPDVAAVLGQVQPVVPDENDG